MTGLVPDSDCSSCRRSTAADRGHARRHRRQARRSYINSQIEQKLRSHVLGPWLDLGFQNWYSTSKPIDTLADLKGMKIRNSGGAGQSWRVRFVGAIPNTTAWPNVPLALSQGTFDGFVSSNESLVSAKLWEAGVKYSSRTTSSSPSTSR